LEKVGKVKWVGLGKCTSYKYNIVKYDWINCTANNVNCQLRTLN